MAEKKDVDLYDELDKTLNKSEAEEADGASAEKPIVDDKTKKEDVKVEDGIITSVISYHLVEKDGKTELKGREEILDDIDDESYEDAVE